MQKTAGRTDLNLRHGIGRQHLLTQVGPDLRTSVLTSTVSRSRRMTTTFLRCPSFPSHIAQRSTSATDRQSRCIELYYWPNAQHRTSMSTLFSSDANEQGIHYSSTQSDPGTDFELSSLP